MDQPSVREAIAHAAFLCCHCCSCVHHCHYMVAYLFVVTQSFVIEEIGRRRNMVEEGRWLNIWSLSLSPSTPPPPNPNPALFLSISVSVVLNKPSLRVVSWLQTSRWTLIALSPAKMGSLLQPILRQNLNHFLLWTPRTFLPDYKTARSVVGVQQQQYTIIALYPGLVHYPGFEQI